MELGPSRVNLGAVYNPLNIRVHAGSDLPCGGWPEMGTCRLPILPPPEEYPGFAVGISHADRRRRPRFKYLRDVNGDQYKAA